MSTAFHSNPKNIVGKVWMTYFDRTKWLMCKRSFWLHPPPHPFMPFHCACMYNHVFYSTGSLQIKVVLGRQKADQSKMEEAGKVCTVIVVTFSASIQNIAITNCLFRFPFSHLPRCRQLLRLKDRKNFTGNLCARFRFSDSNKPSQSVLLIYKFVWHAGFCKSKENLLKTSRKVVPVINVAHIFWWCHDNGKQSASAREHWCDFSCDIPYSLKRIYIWNTYSLTFHKGNFNWIATC